MSILIRFITLSSSLVLLASVHASGNDICGIGNRLTVKNIELKAALLNELKNNDITVQENEEGELCYPSEKADYIREKLISLDLQLRPSNHITIAGGNFAQQVFDRLTKAGIKFSKIEQGNKVILMIEQKSEVQNAVEIIDSIAKSMFNGK